MIEVRVHGRRGPTVILLHGGPGTAGYLAPLARGLTDEFTVLEPLQRGSGRGGGTDALTVDGHAADLLEVIQHFSPDDPPALAGHSWGAMLALAFASAHPSRVAKLALIGCGTFDPLARRVMNDAIARRLTAERRAAWAALPADIPDPDARLAALGRLLAPVFDFHLSEEGDPARCDARAHEETWRDMLARQEKGDFPAAFSLIAAPTAMFHGTHDPHPGRLVRDSLRRCLPHLEYFEFDRCGHSPWLERAAREDFFRLLRSFLR
ncbi:MAG: alpha/beta hydrolase [Pseudomonadota bacterium]